MSVLLAFVALFLSFSIGFLITPLASRIATSIGAVDRPDVHRKKHDRPVALLGGVAVAWVILCSWPIIALLSGTNLSDQFLLGLLPAAALLFCVGLVDDLIGLTGVYKLVGQIFSVSLLVSGGLEFERISVLGVTIQLGSLSIPFTMFFCLGAINAFNLIDGADGLASSVGAIVFLTLAIVATALGENTAALLCYISAGALLAFLYYNAPPAKIYLGDTGSMMIGLVVAAVAIHCTVKEQAAFALMVPVAICAIPIIDAGAAMVRRITTGQSVFSPDRGHLHHSLLLRGWTVSRTVASIAGLTAITCAGALASFFFGNDIYAFATAAGVFILLAVARIFGHVEVALISSHARDVLRPLVVWRGGRPEKPAKKSFVLQGNRDWDKVWTGLTEAASNVNLTSMKLQISAPFDHESYYATWRRENSPTKFDEHNWQVSLPLRVNMQQIGTFTARGFAESENGVPELSALLDFVEPLASQVVEVLKSDVENKNAAVPQARGHRNPNHARQAEPVMA
jgi:UDP-GlcNAc:undecaprenyl-phosphate GlcNAc-1-phosphate transferase